MTDFDLAAAVSAARRQADDAANDGSRTRARIRETLTRDRTRRSRTMTFIAGVIVTMFGSTAFAYYTHWRPQIAQSTPAEAPPAPAPAPMPVLDETPTPVARTIARDDVPAVVVTIEPPTPVPHTTEQRAAAVPDVPPPPDPELAAYRVAHEAHFHGTSPTAALAAWDAYLAAYPNGAMAIDARWSRALLLVKLQRWADATAALKPFADAPAGAYRQAEAARLIAAMPH